MNESPPRPQGRPTGLVIALIAGVIAIPFFLQPRHAAKAPATQGTPAISDSNAAPGDKSTTGKVVMIDFYTDWCHYCTKLDEEVYPEPVVKKAMAPYEFRKINPEKSDANRALAEKYKVNAYPTIVFVDAKGTELDRIEGYLPADEFAKDLNALTAKLKS